MDLSQLPSFTVTEWKMMRMLADGEPHTRKELHSCLEDELGRLLNIKPHLQAIKKKIRPLGEDIVCILGRGRLIQYRRVRVLPPSALPDIAPKNGRIRHPF